MVIVRLIVLVVCLCVVAVWLSGSYKNVHIPLLTRVTNRN